MIDIECGRICPIKISSKIEIKIKLKLRLQFLSSLAVRSMVSDVSIEMFCKRFQTFNGQDYSFKTFSFLSKIKHFLNFV